MSDGRLTFVSWVRRGLATGFHNPDDGSGGASATVDVDVQFNNSDDDIAQVRLTLVGPRDIVGLSSNVVVRTWPRPDDRDAEYVTYPLIEFDQADLPWRYTPAMNSGDVASEDDRLRAWFSLVVLKADEASLNAGGPDQKLQILHVNNQQSLTPPLEAWAFAHTQFEGAEIDSNSANQKISGAPGLFTARVLSPRLLQSNTEYVACLVPTFEHGRQVGLGEEVTGSDPLAPAWDNASSSPVDLPVYFSWTFSTGTIANFEQAARLLKPYVLPPTVGLRSMDVSEPGLGLPSATAEGEPLPVEGALMSVAAFHAGRPTWPDPERTAFIAELRDVLNAPAIAQEADPVLAPPLYAQWYAAESALEAARPTGTNPPWFRELNADPRSRVAAALGTRVIQNDQQALLAGAWDQVEELQSINEKLRVLQLGRGLLGRIYLRHYQTVSVEYFYHLTAKVHSQVVCNTKTVCRRVTESPIPQGFFSIYWIRITRPLGPVGKIQGRTESTGSSSPGLGETLSGGKGPIGDPSINTPHTIDTTTFPGGSRRVCILVDTLVQLDRDVLLHWALAIYWASRKVLVSQGGTCWWIALRYLRFASVLIEIAIDSESVRRRCRWAHFPLDINPDEVDEGPPIPDLTTVPAVPEGFSYPAEVATVPVPGQPGSTDSTLAGTIRDALIAVLVSGQQPADQSKPEAINLQQCYLSMTTQLSPTLTVGRRVTDRISIDTATVDWNPVDPLQPLFVPPEFEQPMYRPLRDISPEWMLPGASELKPDTVSLAVSNQRFIEAYMAGLNHEMTRELLWNEYPTDQRGTYFRQFWSIASHVLENGSTLPPDQLRDILALRLWSKDTELGQNSPRQPPGADPTLPFLVLVIKAQLIMKYPNVIVYAQKINTTRTSLTGVQRYPIFDATIGEDVAFFGFDLTEEEVRADPSWYFVLEEQPGDPKFADEVTDRDASPYTTAPEGFGTSAGLFAQNTFLKPFRLGIQATSLLPAAEG